MVEQPNKILMGTKQVKSSEFINIIVIMMLIIGTLRHIAWASCSIVG
jgi:hypothetical protein